MSNQLKMTQSTPARAPGMGTMILVLVAGLVAAPPAQAAQTPPQPDQAAPGPAPIDVPPPAPPPPYIPFPQFSPLPLDEANDRVGIAQQTARDKKLQARILWIDATANLN